MSSVNFERSMQKSETTSYFGFPCLIVMKIVRVIYKIISIFLVLGLIALTLLSILLGISGTGSEIPGSLLGFRAFRVLSPSMTPTFDTGSLIIIRETDAADLEAGDIIAYIPMRGGGVVLTHRIARIREENGNRTFITQGDANNTEDPNPVEPDNILGRAIFYMNGLGEFMVNLRTPMGIGLLIAVIVVGLFFLPALLAPRERKPADIDAVLEAALGIAESDPYGFEADTETNAHTDPSDPSENNEDNEDNKN
jgi:signal peptidase